MKYVAQGEFSNQLPSFKDAEKRKKAAQQTAVGDSGRVPYSADNLALHLSRFIVENDQ
ncbi:hypothetical protein H0H92_002391, partial [Tricholoma furcatifolium]